MRIIVSPSQVASFNLAAEAALLQLTTDDIFFLYENDPCIVCGKHQNPLAEINFAYTKSIPIDVFRRLSGGGTVYHDTGNLNYCFITTEPQNQQINFQKYIGCITHFLQSLNLNAEMGKRNEILVNSKKVSGTASHISKTRSMHHGTLLFHTDLSQLNKCLLPLEERYTDKAVKSVRSIVINIADELDAKLSFTEFKDKLIHYIKKEYSKSYPSTLNDSEIKVIQDLQNKKFDTWEWNFGYSPSYQFQNTICHSEYQNLTVQIGVEKGKINHIELQGDQLPFHVKHICENLLIQQPHQEALIRDLISKTPEYIEMLPLFFE